MFAGLDFGNTVTPWVLALFLGAFIITLSFTIKAWRDAKSSPYFFQRQQSLQRMQSFSLGSIALLVLTVAVSIFAYTPSYSVDPLTTLIANAKPIDVVRVVRDNPESNSLAETPQERTQQALAETFDIVDSIAETPVLPTEFAQIEPSVELSDSTSIADIEFATSIDDNYNPVAARNEFSEGFYTIYATFDYAEMQDGLVWSWVWKHEGEVVSGGEQQWAYGDEGPGYVYFKPQDGFASGEYILEMWLNGEFVNRNIVEITAGVANQ